MSSDRRDSSPFIQITDQKKQRYFLYNSFDSLESYINMPTSYDSLLAKGAYLMVAILKEAIANKEKFQKDGKVDIQELCQEKDKY